MIDTPEQTTPTAPALPTATVVKPGWKTSEFWLKILALLLTALYASGALTNSAALAIAGIAATMLGALGYTVSRSLVKAAAFVLVVGLVAQAPMACTWAKNEATLVGHAIVDCTSPAARDAAKQFGPVLDALLAQSTDGSGKLNTAPVKDLTKGFTAELGGCVAAAVFSRALHPAPADPNAPKASQLELDQASVRAAFEELRSKQFGGASFKLDDGVL